MVFEYVVKQGKGLADGVFKKYKDLKVRSGRVITH
jgi:hypothetical protein